MMNRRFKLLLLALMLFPQAGMSAVVDLHVQDSPTYGNQSFRHYVIGIANAPSLFHQKLDFLLTRHLTRRYRQGPGSAINFNRYKSRLSSTSGSDGDGKDMALILLVLGDNRGLPDPESSTLEQALALLEKGDAANWQGGYYDHLTAKVFNLQTGELIWHATGDIWAGADSPRWYKVNSKLITKYLLQRLRQARIIPR